MPGICEVVPFTVGDTKGFLHVPAEARHGSLVLTHGAGANCEAPLLVLVANAFVAAGLHVLRFDLPFRQKKRFGPPHPAHAAKDRLGLKTAIDAMRHVTAGGQMFLGGHSYGGRQASVLAAEDQSVADALLLLSYPLHPPEKPEQMRTAHFEKLSTPTLFVHGTGDPFGSIDELEAAIKLISATTDLVTVGGAGHDLKRGKFDVKALVVEPLLHAFSHPA